MYTAILHTDIAWLGGVHGAEKANIERFYTMTIKYYNYNFHDFPIEILVVLEVW